VPMGTRARAHRAIPKPIATLAAAGSAIVRVSTSDACVSMSTASQV
jgi:hypothetical protein